MRKLVVAAGPSVFRKKLSRPGPCPQTPEPPARAAPRRKTKAVVDRVGGGQECRPLRSHARAKDGQQADRAARDPIAASTRSKIVARQAARHPSRKNKHARASRACDVPRGTGSKPGPMPWIRAAAASLHGGSARSRLREPAPRSWRRAGRSPHARRATRSGRRAGS